MHIPRFSVVAAALLAARIAAATTAADFPCDPISPPPGPCRITTTVPVTVDSAIEFGERGLVIATGGVINGGLDGNFSIGAGSVTLEAGGRIVSQNGNVTLTTTTGSIVLEASSSIIDVSGALPGTITLDSGANAHIAGWLLANPTGDTGGEGSIGVYTVTDITITPTGRLSAVGGGLGFGGDISVSAFGNVLHEGTIIALGAFNGGNVLIEGFDVTTTSVSSISVRGGVGSFAALLEIYGDNTLVVNGPINGAASGGEKIGEGQGAEIIVEAAHVTIGGAITMTGGGPAGAGGSLEVAGDFGITQTGRILGEASGNGFGGLVSFDGGIGPVSVGPIDVSGPLRGGSIDIGSYHSITVSNTLSTDGPLAAAVLVGCDVTVLAGAIVSSQGDQALNSLGAASMLLVAGTVRAGATGENRLRYLDPATPPVVTGIVTPAPFYIEDPSLPICGGPTTTTTTSTTSTTILGTTSTTQSGGTSTTVASTTTTTPSTTTTTRPSSTSTTVTLPPTTTTTASSAPSTTTTSTSPTTSTTTGSPTTTTTANPTTTTTQPAAACVPGGCDDGDRCTIDGCDPVAGCTRTFLVEFDGATCRLDGMTATLAAAPDTDAGGPRLKGRLMGRVGKARGLVDVARGAPPKKQRAKLKGANRLVGKLIRTLEKGKSRGKIEASLADHLLELARGAAGELAPLIAP